FNNEQRDVIINIAIALGAEISNTYPHWPTIDKNHCDEILNLFNSNSQISGNQCIDLSNYNYNEESDIMKLILNTSAKHNGVVLIKNHPLHPLCKEPYNKSFRKKLIEELQNLQLNADVELTNPTANSFRYSTRVVISTHKSNRAELPG